MCCSVFSLLFVASSYITAIYAAERLYGSDLINRTNTFNDAKRVFLDFEHELPVGAKLLGFSMYIRPLNTNSQRDHYARFCIWSKQPGQNKDYLLKFQTAARLPKREGIFTQRITDNVIFTDKNYFGVTFEQEEGTITREVSSIGKLMFSDTYRNLPNTNDVITIIQENYKNIISLAAIIDDGSNVNECSSNNGGCQHICTDNTGSYTCSCRSGFRLSSNGRSCDVQDQCSSAGCDHFCSNTGNGGFTCSCRSGYSLNSNGRTCNNINECLTNNGGCQHNCNDNTGSYTCSCRSGFTLSSNGRNCDVQDQCSSAGCDHSCSNTGNGGFTCSCRSGFSLNSNGRTCNNINECNSNNGGCQHNCNDNTGSYTCSCRSGFRLSSNGRNCDVQDQCSSAGCDHSCSNTGNGGFTCSCRSGYSLDSNGRTCNNINECLTNNGGCQHNCNDNTGSYTCSCRSGFRLSSNGRNCETQTSVQGPPGPRGDVGPMGPKGDAGPPGVTGPQGPMPADQDECRNVNCQHKCVNTFGSYNCLCNAGYVLDSNGRNCNNINECGTNNGGCQHNCNDNTGSYTCSCNSGFRLSKNNWNCEDIDECKERQNLCPSMTCVNSIPGYRCVELHLLNSQSGQQDAPYNKSKTSRQIGDDIALNETETFASEIKIVTWLSALSVIVALIISVNVFTCRRHRRREHAASPELVDDSVTEINMLASVPTHVES